MFSLEFSNFDVERGALIQDQTQFDVGKVVEIRMGTGDRLTTLMVGEITGLEAAYTSSGLPGLTVRGFDRRHRLQRGRKVRTFIKQKDSEIVSKIAQEAGLSPQVKDSKIVHDYVLQANQTDMSSSWRELDGFNMKFRWRIKNCSSSPWPMQKAPFSP